MLVLLLSACDKGASEHNFSDPVKAKQSTSEPVPTQTADPHDLNALADELGAGSPDEPSASPIKLPDGKLKIDEKYLKTDVAPADLANYSYPLALDTTAVKNYAKAYNITDKEAQHSMVLSMASPEPLNKLLDQLKDGKYLSHHLTDGANMSLVIVTTPDMVADKFEYVIEGEFGRGLVLPVVIEPKSD